MKPDNIQSVTERVIFSVQYVFKILRFFGSLGMKPVGGISLSLLRQALVESFGQMKVKVWVPSHGLMRSL